MPHRIPYEQYFDTRPCEVQCPKCHAAFRIDAPRELAIASDVLFDGCPECEAVILVDNHSDDYWVIVEAFATLGEAKERAAAIMRGKGAD